MYIDIYKASLALSMLPVVNFQYSIAKQLDQAKKEKKSIVFQRVVILTKY